MACQFEPTPNGSNKSCCANCFVVIDDISAEVFRQGFSKKGKYGIVGSKLPSLSCPQALIPRWGHHKFVPWESLYCQGLNEDERYSEEEKEEEKINEKKEEKEGKKEWEEFLSIFDDVKEEKENEKEKFNSKRWKKQKDFLDILETKIESIPEDDFTIAFCGLASVGKSSIIKLLLQNTRNTKWHILTEGATHQKLTTKCFRSDKEDVVCFLSPSPFPS